MSTLFDVVRSAARAKNSEARKKLTKQAFSVVVTNNIRIIPTMKRSVCTKMEEGTEREHNTSDCNWMFYLEMPEFAPNTFPKKMLCKTPTREDPRKLMTFEELESLYGTDRSQKWECAPHLRNEAEMNVYSKSQMRSQWYVTDLVY